MTKIRRLALAAVLALVLAVPAYAAVTYQSGKYVGKTAQRNSDGERRKISFRADHDAGELKNIKFVSTGKCTDGGVSHGTQGSKGSSLFANPNADGDFKFTVFSKNKATKLTFKGHIQGTKANGEFKVTSHYDAQGNSDPDGSVKCTSGWVKWNAHKVAD
jgi:hypothetical protein